MNKITPHLVRDLDATLPVGTECYLKYSARKALSRYRKGRQAATIVSRELAISLLSQRLGRGLKRFLAEDMQALLPAQATCDTARLA